MTTYSNKHNPMTIEDLAEMENLQVKNGITTIIKSYEVKLTSTGSKYCIAKFLGENCEFEAKIWNCEQILTILETAWEKSLVISITLRRKDFNGMKAFEAEFESIPTNLPDGQIYGVSRVLNLNNCKLEDVIDTIQDTDIRSICKRFWETYKDDLSNHPAGAKVHHAFRGGLVEHITEVIMNGVSVLKGDHSPYKDKVTQKQVDRFICISLFHDAGKLFEMTPSGEYTLWGKALGHIHISTYLFNKILAELDITLNNEDYLIILNGILSHHGDMEMGSPVKPISLEANLVHNMDMFSMHLSKFIDYTVGSVDVVEGNPVRDRIIRQDYYVDSEMKKWVGRTV